MPAPRSRPRRPFGFSLIEMLATVAALVIVLGLMVSLARYVRRQASDQLTKQLLVQLDTLVRNYRQRYNDTVPSVKPFVPDPGAIAGPADGPKPIVLEGKRVAKRRGAPASGPAPVLAIPSAISTVSAAAAEDALPDERTLQESAKANNRSIIEVLRVEARRHPAEYASLPPSFFEEGVIIDAWGTPIVFMASLHPAIGMAMENRPFFLSAGPDRRFRTLEDNLYSYEEEPVALPKSGG